MSCKRKLGDMTLISSKETTIQFIRKPLAAREALLNLQGQRITTSITLIEALGGGWNGTLK